MSKRFLLCGIGKLENNYIREWVEYHRKLGFTNIVLYDNNDPDGERFEDVIGDYIKSGYVILKNWRGRELAQIPSYNDCYRQYKDKYDWIGFWDIDEFLEFESAKTIGEFLSQEKFRNAQCVRFGWKQYTDSGLVSVKDGNYSVKRFKEVFDLPFCKRNKFPEKRFITASTQAKSIIRTNVKDFKVTSPHCFLDVPTVDALGRPCWKAIRLGDKPVWKGAWLNHYRFKTVEEYVSKKMVRLWPTAYRNGGKDCMNLDFFFNCNRKTKEKVKFANDLMEALDKTKICINSWTARDAKMRVKNRNWGDELNYYFLQNIMDKRLVEYKKTGTRNYSFIGSILNNRYVNEHTVIWGAGVQEAAEPLGVKPEKVCAVRGPLTRKYLMDNGVKCPEIYGDPSLLIPYYYYPVVEKKYKVGFIPHWSSIKDPRAEEFASKPGVHMIKMSGYSNWKQVINEILSCECIVSESLHGLIMAEAYGIPNIWADVTLGGRYDIKFHDFFLSIGHDRKEPMKITRSTKMSDISNAASAYKRGRIPDLNKLLAACPVGIKDADFLRRVKTGKLERTKTMVQGEYKSGVSICITAYKAKNYIKETLDSVAGQTWFKDHDNWEVLVGVDNCQETLEYLRGIMGSYKNLRVFMMDSNRGTYVTTNTIMSLARYDGLIRFDADDIMMPNLVEEIMRNKTGCGAVRFKMKNFGMNSDVSVATGQIYMKHSVFDEFGGYRPWICAADTDFKKRIGVFVKVKVLDKVLMRRRVHGASLTKSKETDGKSKIRSEYAKKIAAMVIRSKRDAVIRMETNSCKEIMENGEQIAIIIETPASRNVAKGKQKKSSEKKKSPMNKERPGTKGWGEFFGFV